MQEERFTLLATLYLSGEASPSEKAELDDLLARTPELQARLETMRRLWQSRHEGVPGYQTPDARTKAYERHLQRMQNLDSTARNAIDIPAPSSVVKINHSRRWLIASAAAAGIAGIIFLFNHQQKPSAPQPIATTTLGTATGHRSQRTLPDGTTVWLNADSKLTYDENFGRTGRDIQLSGEAYFDVAKDPGHPFIIHTEAVDIRVLGTSFNVRSYKNEKKTETALIQGAVEVILHKSPGNKIILKPNEKLTVTNDQASLNPNATGNPTGTAQNTEAPILTLDKIHFRKKDSIVTEICWTKNRLAFDNTPLEEVALMLERWYDIKVTIRQERLKDLRMNAFFGKETLPEVAEALAIAGNFQYKLKDRELIIGTSD